jgi:hypothetical protein
MSLLTYEEARPWARAIRERVSRREMPPWFIERNIGIQKFKDDPSLSDAEIATIVKWVDSGATRGNPADAPPARQFADLDKWSIGEPDLIVQAPEYTVAAVGADQWRDLYIDNPLTEDRYIKAVEIKPNSRQGFQVIHHAHAYLTAPDADLDDPFVEPVEENIEEYSVGKSGDVFPEGTGRIMKAGTKIRWNVHYHSIGEVVKASPVTAFKFYPKGYVPKHIVTTQALGTGRETGFDIPAGEVARSDGYRAFTTPVRITSFQPHMHYRGKRECLEAIYPDGRSEMLNCAGFKLGWGIAYTYADDAAPILPAGSILHVINFHDNTTANRGNPDPRNWAGGGNRTVDEMGHAWTSWYPMSEEDYKKEVAERIAQQKKATNNN